MAAYRRVYDSRHLQADCQEQGWAPEPYTLGNRVWATFTFTILCEYARATIRYVHGAEVGDEGQTSYARSASCNCCKFGGRLLRMRAMHASSKSKIDLRAAPVADSLCDFPVPTSE